MYVFVYSWDESKKSCDLQFCLISSGHWAITATSILAAYSQCFNACQLVMNTQALMHLRWRKTWLWPNSHHAWKWSDIIADQCWIVTLNFVSEPGWKGTLHSFSDTVLHSKRVDFYRRMIFEVYTDNLACKQMKFGTPLGYALKYIIFLKLWAATTVVRVTTNV